MMLMKIKITLRYLAVMLLVSLAAASCAKKASEEYPMFWTWMEDREDLDLDSLFVHLKEAGIDGLMLYVPEVEDYRKAAQLAKENDITLYAWIWTLRPRGDRDVLLQEHPEWFDYNLKGECITDVKVYLDSYKFLNPAVPGVHDYVRENVRRVCEIEGIEGICLDYCRIVDRVLPISLSYKYDKVQDAVVFAEYDYGYHPVALEKFIGEYGYDPRLVEDPSRDSLWCSFREKLITDVANVTWKLLSGCLRSDNIHQVFIHLFTHAFLCVLAPLHTAKGVVICYKAAVLAGHLSIDREHFDLVPALRANLFHNRRGSGFSLASSHSHNCHLLYFVSFIQRE